MNLGVGVLGVLGVGVEGVVVVGLGVDAIIGGVISDPKIFVELFR